MTGPAQPTPMPFNQLPKYHNKLILRPNVPTFESKNKKTTKLLVHKISDETVL